MSTRAIFVGVGQTPASTPTLRLDVLEHHSKKGRICDMRGFCSCVSLGGLTEEHSQCNPGSGAYSVASCNVSECHFQRGSALCRQLYVCNPSRLGERVKIRKFPKVVTRGCKRSFGPSERKASCIGAKWGCTGAKEVSEGARDPWKTLAPWVQKIFGTLVSPLSGISHFPPPLPGGLGCNSCTWLMSPYSGHSVYHSCKYRS